MMQTGFQSGQFKLAIIQHVADKAENRNNTANQSQPVLSQNQIPVSSQLQGLTTNQPLTGNVLSSTLEQTQNIAQYKAQIEVQGKILTVTTQFPLEAGDKLELKLNNNQQIIIEKVIPLLKGESEEAITKASTTELNAAQRQSPTQDSQINTKPITQQQIDSVIRTWLTQSRPVASSLLDLSITLEAAAKVIKDLSVQANQVTSEPAKGQQLSNLLLLVSKSLQTNLFDQIPNSASNDFKNNIQSLLKELISWKQTNDTPSASKNAPLSNSSQSLLIDGLNKLQSLIGQTLSQTQLNSSATSTESSPLPLNNTQGNITPAVPILRDWTQVLTLMTPPTQSQNDLVDWMLESIRRIAGTAPPNTAETNQTHLQTTKKTIESSQWLRLAELRKHQLFTGNIKSSLLQNTQDSQISNILRQVLINVEELTGRLTALRLASAGSQNDTLPTNHLHIDLPILTPNGPTAIEVDLTEEREETTNKTKSLKSQWTVHLKFELPPLATFICQLIMNTETNTFSATFFTDHQETLSLLNKHISVLDQQCKEITKSAFDVSTRFGIIDMPRESIVKTTSQALSVKV